MDPKSAMEQLDIGALNSAQQEQLEHFKIKTRISNENYLRSHPEVELLLGEFLREVFLKRPVDIREFAAVYFTNPELPEKIIRKMDERTSK
ncbi:RIIa domain-containing protein 1-like isoform X2 [Erpetoichthys calabaricus]|uniref:RIIa domain-containing protein 1-like isoform X2 n=1 Tax=Erpetoichthys calabaricus TaxID=27687 RepID=UPI00109FDFD4|nr:RIIa domain-containing protein 1-like isoform X2 [Erpetoichthys calabaricus]